MSKEEKFKLYSSAMYGSNVLNYIDTDNVEPEQLFNELFGRAVNENMKLEIKQQACNNITEIVKLIDRITDIYNIAYEPEQKALILNKLYNLLDFQIKLLEEDKDE